MKTTLKDLMKKPLEWNPYLGVWIDPQVGGATATTRDWKDGGNPDVDVPLNALLGRVAWLAGWPSPITNDATGSTHCYSGGDKSRPALKLPGSALWRNW